MTYDFIHGDPDQMARLAAKWTQEHEDMAARNKQLNSGNTGLAAAWKGASGSMFVQQVEPDRHGQNQKLTTTGQTVADTVRTTASKYSDADSSGGQVLGAAGNFSVDGAAISSAIGTTI
ncbi:hypothetical protein FNH05_29740 [Amycolatopsis rhizosphaerae]|uniref:Uncharacterized protein n=1 Tax=Amycolatopsis rhizosphaerae TaxID=2053003 RepID=A0A558B0B8_9PSEU|nr:WXG100 family type VII secretion target [Amycolatopsis rhizosphaerae]TVT29972.1 hypothetical protein FNH05_29740 [Amycolatopsis rhizosphaerae]